MISVSSVAIARELNKTIRIGTLIIQQNRQAFFVVISILDHDVIMFRVGLNLPGRIITVPKERALLVGDVIVIPNESEDKC